jgi:hypothetical protein
MEWLNEFVSWAWARHQNPLSWYIRPLFVLPFCYFAWKKNVTGVVLTVIAVLSSMFWFPVPDEPSARAVAFLEMEQQYVSGGWTPAKSGMAALVPVWFVLLAWAFWRRSWVLGLWVFNVGAALKVLWSFAFGGDSAWSIIPPVLVGAIVCNGVVVYAVRRRAAAAPAPG